MADVAGDAATGGLRWIWRQVTSRLWFRVSLFAAGAVLTALVAVAITPLVPAWITESIGDRATWDVLSILASSMLVVATFSLGTMVQAFAAAAQSATPRAARVLIDDPFSQNVLATFLGAFVFAMVGLVALGFGYYSVEGKTVLLVAAGLVIVIVIATFFAWLDHLANMVRLGETQRKIEIRAEPCLRARAAAPHLGGVPIEDAHRAGHPLTVPETLYVQNVDMAALQAIAEEADGSVGVACLPGALVDPSRPLLWTSWQPDEKVRRRLQRAFVLARERALDQDPRFCLQVLAEIGSRALSPATNDAGTAIGIVAGQQRLLTIWSEAADGRGDARDDVAFPRVATEPVTVADLFEDAFAPLVRDGAGIVEVGVRIQKALAVLAARETQGFAAEAVRMSRLAVSHADAALVIRVDKDRVGEAAARVGTAA